MAQPVARTRVPQPMMAAILRVARLAQQSPSQFMRECIRQGLRERGEWPPRTEVANGE